MSTIGGSAFGGDAKSFSLRRDFAPNEARGEDTPSVSPRELHISKSRIIGKWSDISIFETSNLFTLTSGETKT